MRVDRGVMNKLRVSFGGRCQKCGSTRLRFLEFAHLRPTPVAQIPRGRGIRNRYYDIRRNPECYVLLCRWCHRAFDFDRARGIEVFLELGPTRICPDDAHGVVPQPPHGPMAAQHVGGVALDRVRRLSVGASA